MTIFSPEWKSENSLKRLASRADVVEEDEEEEAWNRFDDVSPFDDDDDDVGRVGTKTLVRLMFLLLISSFFSM